MTDRNRVIEQIYQAIDQVNLQLPPDQQIDRAEKTILIGDAGALDSLAFLNLIVTSEEKISSAFNVALPLALSLMESDADQLPRSVGELADLVCKRLESCYHG